MGGGGLVQCHSATIRILLSVVKRNDLRFGVLLLIVHGLYRVQREFIERSPHFLCCRLTWIPRSPSTISHRRTFLTVLFVSVWKVNNWAYLCKLWREGCRPNYSRRQQKRVALFQFYIAWRVIPRSSVERPPWLSSCRTSSRAPSAPSPSAAAPQTWPGTQSSEGKIKHMVRIQKQLISDLNRFLQKR